MNNHRRENKEETMKKNEKRKLWKQGLGTALVCGLAVAVFPAAKADAADLLKAGPINTTAEHVTQNQPFAERTAGSQYFRIPAFIVTQKGNLLAAADARYSTTGDGGGLDTIASVSTDNGKTWNFHSRCIFRTAMVISAIRQLRSSTRHWYREKTEKFIVLPM